VSPGGPDEPPGDTFFSPVLDSGLATLPLLIFPQISHSFFTMESVA
jgi:hypothetical protein